MTSTALDRQQGTLPKEALLGRIMWYSVPTATCLDPTVVGKALKNLGFTRRIPGLPAESNVFRRVTAEADRRGIPIVGTDQFENLLVRMVNAKRDNVLVRSIVVETVDPSGRRLAYDQVVNLEFHYDNTVTPNVGKMKTEWVNGFSPTTHPRAAAFVEDMKADFYRWKGMFHDALMRGWIKQTLIDMGAVSVRPTGGIYFLKEEHASQVEALEQFITDHLPVGGECHSVEIPNVLKQREMVQRAIEAETVGAIETMMGEVEKIQAEGNLTPQRYLAIIQEIQDLEAKLGDYSKLLETDIRKVDSRTRLLKGMVSGLAPLQKKATRTRKK